MEERRKEHYYVGSHAGPDKRGESGTRVDNSASILSAGLGLFLISSIMSDPSKVKDRLMLSRVGRSEECPNPAIHSDSPVPVGTPSRPSRPSVSGQSTLHRHSSSQINLKTRSSLFCLTVQEACFGPSASDLTSTSAAAASVMP